MRTFIDAVCVGLVGMLLMSPDQHSTLVNLKHWFAVFYGFLLWRLVVVVAKRIIGHVVQD